MYLVLNLKSLLVNVLFDTTPNPSCSHTFVFWWTSSSTLSWNVIIEYSLSQLKKCFFHISMETIVRETKSFITIKLLIDPNYPWQNGVKLIKTSPVLKTQTLVKRSKCSKNYCFWIFTLISLYTWVNLICLTCLIFLKSFWWLHCTKNRKLRIWSHLLEKSLMEYQFGHFVLWVSSKKLY